ncbi:CPBP family intramembrane glutamic endopeptidase [Oceanicola sp. S124]|uniref:CPBP family intramembrane glutamic endopeptidase n=1 Tax=Oceanicola sp. S124 TaxID=1042378 RepID=UPI00025578F5|nr:type II CAAX endopeptidase family protein [Oceanicola sp. S124]
MTADAPHPTPSWDDAPATLWRTSAGLCIFIVLYGLLISLWFMTATSLIAGLLPGPAAATVLMLFSFASALLALELVLRALHGRGLIALTGPGALFWPQLLRVALHALPVVVVLSLLPLPDALTPVRHLDLAPWLALLPLALAGVAVQIAAEEFLFRGYLQSRLQARFRHPVLWLGLPALFFGLLHFDPAGGDNAPWFVLYATLFGLVTGDLTARSGSLGPAMALHFLNNCIALTVTSFPDGLGGLSLWHLPVRPDDPALQAVIPLELGATLVLWLAARVAIRR